MEFKKRTVLMLTAAILFLCSGSVSASFELESYDYTKEELSFRQQFGLDTNISKVKQMDSKDDNIMVDSKFGVRLTKLEEEQLIKRINHQTENLPLVKEYLDKNIKDGLVFIDQKSGGIINIGIKADTNKDQYESDFKKIYGDSSLINVFVTKYSENDLNELNEKLISLINTDFNGVTITDTLVDLAEQKIQVGVKDFNETKRKILEETFNADMLSIRESAVVSDDVDRNSTYNPLQAGTKIVNNNTGGYCSIGFLAKPSGSISGYIVTAAHCGTAGNSFNQGTNNVGAIGTRVYGGSVDAATIGTSSLSYSNDLYTSSSRAGYFDTVQANDFAGSMVCMSGASSATNPVSCGTILSKSVSYSIDGVTFSNLRSASYTSAPGDSGAPTYYGTVLMGINKGRHNGNAVYSYIGNVLNAMPVQPILN
ncbi:S1 family peptidase [Paenibacillus sp. FSL F4-0236]|uniref:S1 family peptidase n=1 Tax=Paenibacillus sp. FSL F4-0236 TaxID=2954731 RepID=UPI0030FC0600